MGDEVPMPGKSMETKADLSDEDRQKLVDQMISELMSNGSPRPEGTDSGMFTEETIFKESGLCAKLAELICAGKTGAPLTPRELIDMTKDKMARSSSNMGNGSAAFQEGKPGEKGDCATPGTLFTGDGESGSGPHGPKGVEQKLSIGNDNKKLTNFFTKLIPKKFTSFKTTEAVVKKPTDIDDPVSSNTEVESKSLALDASISDTISDPKHDSSDSEADNVDDFIDSSEWIAKMAAADKQIGVLVAASPSSYTQLSREFEATNIINWYPRLAKYTIRTKFVKVSEEFVAYLGNDELHLPDGIETSASSGFTKEQSDQVGYTLNDSEEEDDDLGGLSVDSGVKDTSGCDSTASEYFDAEEGVIFDTTGCESDPEDKLNVVTHAFENMVVAKPAPAKQFDEINKWISDTIKELGGKAFPKLNWKSPKDAAWVAYGRQLACYLPGDVYLLMKCSNIICNMIEAIPEGLKSLESSEDGSEVKKGAGYFLALREWIDIAPDSEFRCFVMAGRLVGMSQRDTNCSFPSIETERDAIIWNIYTFFTKISPLVGLENYVFDVVHTKKKVILIDLNTFCEDTDPCLFTYADLEKIYDEMLKLSENKLSLPEVEFETGKDKLPWTDDFGEPCLRFLDKRVGNPYLNTGMNH